MEMNLKKMDTAHPDVGLFECSNHGHGYAGTHCEGQVFDISLVPGTTIGKLQVTGPNITLPPPNTLADREPGCILIIPCTVTRLPVNGLGKSYQMSQTLAYTSNGLSAASWSSAVVEIFDAVESEFLLFDNVIDKQDLSNGPTFSTLPGSSAPDLDNIALFATSFELPEDKSWYISSVRFAASKEVNQGDTIAAVWIFEDDNGVPDSDFVYFGKTIYFSCSMDQDIGKPLCSAPLAANPLLSGGLYWISIALDASLDLPEDLSFIVGSGTQNVAFYCGSQSLNATECEDTDTWTTQNLNFSFQVFGSEGSDSSRISSIFWNLFKLLF